MLAKISLANEMGRPLSTSDRKARQPFIGLLRIAEARSNALGRAHTQAQLISAIDSVPVDVVPPLMDASVIWVNGKEIRIRGTEVRDGIHLAQTWVCEVQ